MFRSMTLYQLTQQPAAVEEKLLAALKDESNHFADVLPNQQASRGFVSPLGENAKTIDYKTDGALLFCIRADVKEIPSGAVKLEAKARAAAREAEGEELSKTDLRIIKDDVLQEMLPRAIPTPSWTYGYLDTVMGMLMIGSGDGADDVVAFLKGVLRGTPFKLLGLNDVEPCDELTKWLKSPDTVLPEDFTLGDACSLKHPKEGGTAVFNITHEELDGEDIQTLLDAGKKCCRIAINHPDIEFAFTRHLGLRRMALTKERKADLAEHDEGIPEDNRANEFAAWVTAIRTVMGQLETLLGGWPTQEMLDLKSEAA